MNVSLRYNWFYKNGDKSNPGNYRGITLTSTLSKLFTYILNERLLKWLDFHQLSSQSQFAYKPGYNTTDAVYVLHSILDQSMTKSDVHCAFIDFTKAFDNVNRSKLYTRLMALGIDNKMLKIIMNMYSKLKSKVKTSDGYTKTFPMNKGLLQGECLSPTLFSAYINDIVSHSDAVEEMGVFLNNVRVTVLKYTDDLVLIATSATSLQKGLNALQEYCEDNELIVNTNKSKVMCFAKKQPKYIQKVKYNEQTLERVEEFKYLGVTFSSQNKFQHGLEILCQKASRAQTVVDLHLLKHKTLSVRYIMDLFCTLVILILLYGSEVYGTQNYKVIEKFHLKFLKRTLNVKQSTNTCMVYAEMGQFPLSINIKVNMMKQWLKIIHCDKEKLIWHAYHSMKIDTNQNNKRVNWATQIKRMLDNTGFGYIWEQQRVNHSEQFIAKFRIRCQDLYIQECFSQIEKSSRCRLYRNLKEVFEMEWYLQENFNRELRQCFSKIR